MSFDTIRTTIGDISTKLQDGTVKEEKRLKSAQEMITKLLAQLHDENAVEKLYLCYLIVEFINKHNPEQKLMTDFIRSIFPPVLNKRQAALASQLISLALTLRCGPLLNCMHSYFTKNCDSIVFPPVPISQTLAHDSPMFCCAVITHGYFLLHNENKEHLSHWLEALVDQVPNHSINLNKAIRFSFLDRPSDTRLHGKILDVIKNQKCEPLSNSLFIDLATSISNLPDNEMLIDRFAHMIVIGLGAEVCSLTNQLKGILLNKFPDHNLFKLVCK